MPDVKPSYAFSIPSIADDLALSCRIYHPKHITPGQVKGAVLAHPYAPLGGCFDDPVVLAATEVLLKQGFVVGTFNFRGAGDSEGRTSWTGKAEQEDYMSVAGFAIYYLQALNVVDGMHQLKTIPSGTNMAGAETPQHLVLGGYSYGSLILARLPPVDVIINRFETAEKGTAATEIVLRARTLAHQTRKALLEAQSPTSPRRGRQLDPKDAESPQSPGRRIGTSPVIMGGEETDPATRRRSRDAKRSVDLLRKSIDVPHRIKAHVKGAESQSRQSKAKAVDRLDDIKPTSTTGGGAPVVTPMYLILSPFLLPFTSVLSPPGPPSILPSLRRPTSDDAQSGGMFLAHPTLAVFGSADGLTTSKRLQAWAERTSSASNSIFEWQEITGAGHFWHEKGVMKALQKRIETWVQSTG